MTEPRQEQPAEDLLNVFGRNMARARRMLGITQDELGSRLGVSRHQVNRWERGGRKPREGRQREIAEALGQPLPFFYEEPLPGEGMA